MISRFANTLACTALLCVAAIVAVTNGRLANAQTAPKFEVATVKLSALPNPGGFFTFPSPGRLSAPNFPLRMLIGFAYSGNGPGPEITGGPKWINEDRYNIQAQAEGPATPAELRLMLRTLLAERFALKMHTESKEIDVYALVLARSDGKLGPKVTPTEGGECGNAPPAVPCAALIQPTGLRLANQTMAMLGNLLSANITGLGRRVVDRTGLTGKYNMNFEFRWPPQGTNAAPEDPFAPSIFTALQEQLGVKLESSRGTQEFLVVDSAERPTEN